MKKMMNPVKNLVLSFFALPFLLFSCAQDIDSASTTAGIDSVGNYTTKLKDNDGKSDKDLRKDGNSGGGGGSTASDSDVTVKDFGDNFIRGFDASAVDYFENVYASSNDWTDANWYEKGSSEKKGIFTVLAAHGFNTIRLRVWVDPSVTRTITNDNDWPTSTDVKNSWKLGDCTLERTTKLAKRAKSAGFKVMIDFHLSDYWTDPSTQLIPESWQGITTSSEMAEKLSSYIAESLAYLKENDVTPDFVQVGNEIDRGILVDKSVNAGTKPDKTATYADSAVSGGHDSANFKTYIKAACKAVRDFDENIKIILHMTTKNESRFSDVPSDTEYDIVGLSYYAWEEHGTISNLKSVIQKYTNAGKQVMVVETSASAIKYGDNYEKHMSQAYSNLELTGISDDSVYKDIEVDSSKVVSSESNQKNILRHIMQEVYESGEIGICVWGGERRDYQYGLFDWNGKAYDGLDAFNYKPVDGYTEDETTDETMTVKFVFSGFTAETVTVKYGSSATSMTTTADVSIASDKASATAKLYKSKFAAADSNNERWGNLKIEVTDSNGAVSFSTSENSEFGATNGPSAKNYWFKFSKDSTMTVNCAKLNVASMTLVLDFGSNTTVTSISGTYDDTAQTAFSANLSEGKATVTISGAYSEGAWINAYITNTDMNGWSWSNTSAGGQTESGKIWFQFYSGTTLTATKNSSSAVINLPYTVSYTGDNTLQKIIEDTTVFGDYTAITVVASNIVWAESSSNNYIGACDSSSIWTNKLDLWDDSGNKKIDIKSGDNWSGNLYSGVKSSGLYIAATNGMTCTLTISGWNQ